MIFETILRLTSYKLLNYVPLCAIKEVRRQYYCIESWTIYHTAETKWKDNTGYELSIFKFRKILQAAFWIDILGITYWSCDPDVVTRQFSLKFFFCTLDKLRLNRLPPTLAVRKKGMVVWLLLSLDNFQLPQLMRADTQKVRFEDPQSLINLLTLREIRTHSAQRWNQ